MTTTCSLTYKHLVRTCHLPNNSKKQDLTLETAHDTKELWTHTSIHIIHLPLNESPELVCLRKSTIVI